MEQFLDFSEIGLGRGGHFGSFISVVRACSRVVRGAGDKRVNQLRTIRSA